jgi:RND family efflux transporter MFP subunit
MFAKLFKIILPVAVVAGGVFVALWYVENPATVERRPAPPPMALPVETAVAESGDYTVVVEAMGQVIPATSAQIRPQVGGEIITTADGFVPGGFFAQDDVMLQIEPADYELAVKKQQALFQQAEAAYRLEMGRQEVAKNELEMLERTTGKKPANTALALRRPQLDQARAEMEKVKADLDTAQLALSRTAVKAPFNALVTERRAVRGDRVAAQEIVATLAGTDEYWVELSVPLSDLRWLHFLAPAEIVLDGKRGARQAQLVRMTGRLDEASRLAGVLVAVADPMLLAKDAAITDFSMMLGDYVRVRIKGKQLTNTVRVPLAWLRDGSIVWTAQDGLLKFNAVQILREDRDYAYIAEGLTAGDMVVTSDISVPVEGMKIRTDAEAVKENVTSGAILPEGGTE